MLSHRYGKCFHNKDGSSCNPEQFYHNDNEGSRDAVKTSLSSFHKFTFSLAKTFSWDYFTEKRYQALLGGSVPIVWNNHKSLDYLPDPDAALIVDWKQYDAIKASNRIQEMAANETLYQTIFEWKKRGLPADFVQKLFLSSDFVGCRICEYVAHKHHSRS